MTICAFYSVWNEEDSIALSMRSVAPLVDSYVIADGRYEGSGEGMSINSTDKTLQIARQFPNVRIIRCNEALPQVEKWNLCCNTGADWTVIMAGHQILFGDLHRLRYELGYKRNFGSVDIDVIANLDELIKHVSWKRCRIFHKSSGFHFENHHWIRKNGRGQIIDGRGWYCSYVKALCLHELRNKERQQIKQNFLLWRSNNPNKEW
jgi:hypothetical protein